jgi:sugar phosphate isomerase/epimerase
MKDWGNMRLGVLVAFGHDPAETIGKVVALGFPTCQISCRDLSAMMPETARDLRTAADRAGIAITTIWAGASGQEVWDFVDGPRTIGLVPAETRAERLAALKRGAEFAAWAGVAGISSHVGFIPENPGDPVYADTLAALRELALYCGELGLDFWFETGQETPITLLRTIEDLGLPNLGINLDPANLLMYGKANPIDALDVFGRYVRGVHAKDGEYPTNGRELGVEKPLGQGRVNFPAFVGKLRDLGYGGALTIEREISGERQIADIKAGKDFLESLLR